MNEKDQVELTSLKQRQMLLWQELRGISRQLRNLETRLKKEPAPTETKQDNLASTDPPISAPPRSSALPPPLPPVIGINPSPMNPPAPASHANIDIQPKVKEALGQTEGFLMPPVRTPAPNRGGSLELRLGTYWAPRVGIVVLLTGLVFVANLAYQNLGRSGRVLLLYFASSLLLGSGWWWQRKAVQATLRNYAQVLFAGGLAALYFTTYAAHHLETLRVISSVQWDGVLLLCCAGLIAWTADRWRSEILALFGTGLAYYTCVITRAGSFTLYSNLLLAAAAVFFLVRQRWATLTFGSVVASYGAYAFWRFFNGSEWHWATPAEGLWSGIYFLAAYWMVFSAGVFLTRDEKFAGQNRAAFLTLNNGAFFTSFLLTILQVGQTAIFWQFALIYGAVLIALSEVSRAILRTEPLARDFYLSQGLLLVTVGFISKLAGLNLALVLAAESVLLLLLGQARKSTVLLAAAYVTGALSVGWVIDGMRLFEPSGIYLAVGVGGLMLVNTLLVHRRSPHILTPLLRADRSFFAVLALTTWLVATYNNSTRQNFPLLLAGEGLVLTFSIYLLRVRELSLLSQGFILIAQGAWFIVWTETWATLLPWWHPALLLSMSLVLSHWWQRQKTINLPNQGRVLWQEVYALLIVGVLWFWLGRRFAPSTWLAVTSGLAVGITLYSVLTRAWLLAATAQIFMCLSVALFALQLAAERPALPMLNAAVPITALLLLSFSTVAWFNRRPDSDARVRCPLLNLAVGYRWVAIAMSVAWISQYIPAHEQIWVHIAIATGLFVWSGWKHNSEALAACAVYAIVALALFWIPSPEREVLYSANLFGVLALLAQQQFARRSPARYPLAPWIHTAAIIAGVLSIWRFCTLWITQQASGFYLTASWSFLALLFFACGILLRERTYRWLGLTLLAGALGRIVVFDVWKLQTLYRILSFMALGVVLLVLGYIYSRFQEKIKEWL